MLPEGWQKFPIIFRKLPKTLNKEIKGGAVVRALAFNQYGTSSNFGVDTIFG